MKSPRHQLILLGLICQGFSWDDYFLPLMNAGLWVLCLTWPRKNFRLSQTAEGCLLLGGCALAYVLGLTLHKNTHFFLGHGLTLLQLVRLLRPLARREAFFSILIALFHLSVACTFLFDLRVILILVAAVILIPRVLAEWEAVSFQADEAEASPPVRPGFSLFLYVTVALGATLAFLALPRVFLGSQLAMRNPAGGEAGTMLDSVLDSTRGGVAQPSRVIMQVEGENLGYLRCFTLVDFDGIQWTSPNRNTLKRLDLVPRAQMRGYEYRRVRVKNATFLGRALPTDGTVVRLSGNFFSRAYENSLGGVVGDFAANIRDSTYEYWTSRRPHPEPLLPSQRLACTAHPPVSPRVRAWLEFVLGGVENPVAQARKLEAYFRSKFTYELGTPELSRLDPLEDFLFRQRKGHCERFASALALLLRLKEIPTRVVVGYVPVCRNLLSAGYNIRFKDAHAWTEAYFPEFGWVQLDATPRGIGPTEHQSFSDLFQDLDVAWSLYVVNFDGTAQFHLFSMAVRSFGSFAAWIRQNVATGSAALLLAVLMFCWRPLRQRLAARPETPGTASSERRMAEHYYGQLLELLQQQGFHRGMSQTPFEFLQAIKTGVLPGAAEVEMITQFFCSTRYGRRTLARHEQKDIQRALEKIRKPGPRTISRLVPLRQRPGAQRIAEKRA
jgi:hypothetical protein